MIQQLLSEVNRNSNLVEDNSKLKQILEDQYKLIDNFNPNSIVNNINSSYSESLSDDENTPVKE